MVTKTQQLKKLSNKKGWVLVLDAGIDDSDFLLTNIYNANMEKEQVSVLNELITILSNLGNTLNHNVIFPGDFNIFFDASLDAKGGTLTLKGLSVNKLIELIETLNLCDMQRKRNPKKRQYTFQQKHLSGIIQRRIIQSEGLDALLTDHSPVFCSISKQNEVNKRKDTGLWKFNNSLISNTDFVKQMKN